MWTEYHETFEVLPHYDEELYNQMAMIAGGEDTNTFKQEYLAEFGTETEGVFNQKKLNLSYFIMPYIELLEEVEHDTRTRKPRLAARSAKKNVFQPHWDAVGPYINPNIDRNPIGAESVWTQNMPGHITAGTDWNDVAGMQTVLVWWPPKEWLDQGNLQIARFPYDGHHPITNRRAKDERGRPRTFTVGSTNGNPGGGRSGLFLREAHPSSPPGTARTRWIMIS